MHKKFNALAACALTLAAVEGTNAQLTAVGPVEIFNCNYTDAGSYDRFLSVVEDWNEWMDDQGIESYTGVALQPYYHGADLNLDLAWLGAWPSSTAEGELMGAVIRDGAEISASFDEVVQCAQHSRFFGGFIKPFASPADAGLRQFRNCWLMENRSIDDALGAIGDWLEWGAQFDMDTAHAVLFPIEGMSDEDDYDLKWMVGFPSAEAYGIGGDVMVQNGAGAQFAQIFAKVMTCDSPRLYVASVERRGS